MALRDLVKATGRLFFVTYTYGTYPMVAQAREMVRARAAGRACAWSRWSTPRAGCRPRLEASGSRQASWRTDPALAGEGGCLGDIGTHAYHLVEFVTGLRTQSVAAELTTFRSRAQAR